MEVIQRGVIKSGAGVWRLVPKSNNRFSKPIARLGDWAKEYDGQEVAIVLIKKRLSLAKCTDSSPRNFTH